MKTFWQRTVAATTVALLISALISTSSVAAPEDEPLLCGSAAVQRTLPNGSAWRMCARIHPIKGLLLEQVEFKPASGSREYSGYMRVIDELYLSQLNVPYDTGYSQFNDITGYGFGDSYLLPQNDAVCEGDTLQIEQAFTYSGSLVQRTIPGICLAEVRTGLATHANEDDLGNGKQITAQGSALEVSSLSKIAWYEYQQRIVFDDHGGIDVGLGATGDLAPDDAGGPFFSKDTSTGWPLGGPDTEDGDPTQAASHWHSAIWRVDFGIGGEGSQFVEQWDYTATDEGKPAPVTRGTGTRKARSFSAISGQDHQALSWWRVGNDNSLNPDGLARSYEIVNNNRPNESIPVTQPIMTVTNDRECEEYASDNLHPGCAGDSILDYVAADDTPLTDPILWVNVGFHHIDRNEDQSPMPMHWQRFQLVPRDFFAQSPSITKDRICINGASGGINSLDRPCVATNVSRPRITASNTPVAAGVLLSATKGGWVENRTTWNYNYMWFRDGEPITRDVEGIATPETGISYVVDQTDAGHEITVKVTASQIGFETGVAESKALLVPGGPTPTATTPAPTATTPASPKPTATRPTPTPQRLKSRISAAKNKTVKAKKRVAITVRVRASGAMPSGKVTIKRGSKSVTGRLVDGAVRLKFPKITKPGRYKFTITYAGSSRILPARKTVILKVTKR